MLVGVGNTYLLTGEILVAAREWEKVMENLKSAIRQFVSERDGNSSILRRTLLWH